MATKEDALNRKDLAAADQARLERIVSTDPETLTSADRDFILARRDYLTASELKDLGITKKVVDDWAAANASDGEDDDDEDDDAE